MHERMLPGYPDFDELAQAAFQGDPKAQFLMGEALRFGCYGLPPDETMARKWYEKSAAQGGRTAIFLLNNWRNRAQFDLYGFNAGQEVKE